MKIIIWITVLALTFLSGSASYGADKKYLKALGIQELKEEAPDFTIKGSDGKVMSLKDFKGKVVILHFWATWCKPCKDEFPAFEKLYRELKGKEAAFLPIAVDTKAGKDEVDAFARGIGATFPVFLARDCNMTSRYWTWGVPVTYFIDKRGWIIGRTIGPRDWASDGVNSLINDLLEEK